MSPDRHVIVTRFSVPRPGDTSTHHADRDWLARRLDLFRRYFVPSVGRLEVSVVLLCSSQSAELVAAELRELEWASVVVQDDWYGGWTGEPGQLLTRLDSDDALHEGWFRALDAASAAVEAGAYCTRRFLRLDERNARLYAYRRREPSPLAAFPGDKNPYAHDHAELERHCKVHFLRPAFLLQVVHGGNVSNRYPSKRRFYLRVRTDRLAAFGLDPASRPDQALSESTRL